MNRRTRISWIVAIVAIGAGTVITVLPVIANAAEGGPSAADFARLQADVARLQQEAHEQKQLLMNIMQADQQRYDVLFQLLRNMSAQGAVAPGLPPMSNVPLSSAALPSTPAPSRSNSSGDESAGATASDVGTVSGKVTLPAGTRDAYVYVDGLRPGGRERTRTVEIRQKDKRFSPETVAVPVGTRLVFPNFDTVFHNVFSPTPGGTFDAGTIKGGTVSQPVALTKPGHVEIFCNLHRGMRADVLVVPNGYFVKVDRDGDFQLSGVPVGSRKLVLWGPQIKSASQRVDVSPRGTSVRFTAEAAPLRPHLNKAGQVYGSYDE